MKKLIGLAVFVTMGLFAVAAHEAPAAQVGGDARTEPATQVSRMTDAEDALPPDSVICQINCCEVNEAGQCIICRRVCP